MKRCLFALVATTLFLGSSASADETCQSPYMAKIVGQEDYIYVWTLGIEGLGDGSDKVVTVGANPARPDYGRIEREADQAAGTGHARQNSTYMYFGNTRQRYQFVAPETRDYPNLS